MHKLPIRCQDGRWQIYVPSDNSGRWIDCACEADCLQMAISGNLAFDAIERVRSGAEITGELELCAALFRRYGCNERALWLEEHAKFARGEPSIFDQLS